MESPIAKFQEKLYSDWLPSFCDARAKDFRPEGFVENSFSRLTNFDAHWFMRAIESGLVIELAGFFDSPQSKTKAQIFWSGRRGSELRKLFLWAEPIFAIGACARLSEEFGWPPELIGMESALPWPFDLTCYKNAEGGELIVCEVKNKTKKLTY